MTENCALLERIGIIKGAKKIGLGAISEGRETAIYVFGLET